VYSGVSSAMAIAADFQELKQATRIAVIAQASADAELLALLPMRGGALILTVVYSSTPFGQRHDVSTPPIAKPGHAEDMKRLLLLSRSVYA